MRRNTLRMYGRVTSSLFNLVAYNVFGADGGSSAMWGALYLHCICVTSCACMAPNRGTGT
jgi:hypothetical protein